MIIIWGLQILHGITNTIEFLFNGDRIASLLFRFDVFQDALGIAMSWNYLIPIADLFIVLAFIIAFEIMLIGVRVLLGFLSMLRGGGHIEL